MVGVNGRGIGPPTYLRFARNRTSCASERNKLVVQVYSTLVELRLDLVR
jgi:hypothetical protein